MLHAMRRGAKSWVAKGLMLLLIASFAVWGIGDVFSTRQDSAVATVGDQTVTVNDYANALQRQRNRLSQQAGRAVSYADMRSIGLDRQVLSGLIRDAAFRAELDRLGLAVPDAAVAEAIRTNPAFQNDEGQFSDPAYRLTVSRLGFTPVEFEELTREVLGQQILRDAARPVAEVPPGAARRLAAYEAEAREIATLVLPLSAAADPGTPTEAELAAHHEANPDAWRVPERRTGRVLHVDIDRLAARQTPSEAALREAYDLRRDRYETPATRVIDQLPLPRDGAAAQANRVTSGAASFEELARDLGERPGDLAIGQVERADLPPAVAEAAFGLSEPGVVGPVDAPAGPVLIRVRAVTEGGSQPFAEVRDALAADLAREAALARAPELAGRIEDLRAEGRTLPEIAEALDMPLIGFEGLARDGALAGGGRAEGLLARDPVRAEIFAALDFEEREIMETREGGYFVVLVERIEPARVPPLEEVREDVAADWAEAERRAALEAEAAALAADLAGEPTLAALAETRGLPVETFDAFPRTDPPAGLPGGLVERVFEVTEGDAAFAPVESGVRLAEVIAVAAPGAARLDALAAEIAGGYRQMLEEDAGLLFAQAIRQQYEVSIDQDAIDAVFAMLGAAQSGSGG